MTLPTLPSTSIALIVFYTPSLLLSIYLSYIHGFSRNSGWLYQVIFSLIRLLYASFQLASIYSDPSKINLIVGAQTLLSIGISALVLVMLGLLSRLLESIDHQGGRTIITARHLRFVQLFVAVGLILGIVGGEIEGDSTVFDAATGEVSGYSIASETKVGLGFVIAGFGIVVIAVVLTGFQVSKAEKGEKRLLLAVGLAVPFVLVRVVFSCMAVFSSTANFMAFNGSSSYPDYLLGMAIIMEMCAVVIFEGVGLTLRRVSKEERRRIAGWMARGRDGGRKNDMRFGLEGAARRRMARGERGGSGGGLGGMGGLALLGDGLFIPFSR